MLIDLAVDQVRRHRHRPAGILRHDDLGVEGGVVVDLVHPDGAADEIEDDQPRHDAQPDQHAPEDAARAFGDQLVLGSGHAGRPIGDRVTDHA